MTLILRKRGNTLIAESAYAHDMLAKITNETEVRAVVRVPRNAKQNALLHCLVNTCLAAQKQPRYYHTEKQLMDAIKTGIGYVDKDGKPLSTAFDELDQVEFQPIWDAAIDFILTDILPGCDKPGIVDAVYHALGMRGPGDERNCPSRFLNAG